MQDYLDIEIASQQLTVYVAGEKVQCYSVSTAKNGMGEVMGSQCTPGDWHRVRAKIGADQPLNAVFIGRRATGEVYNPELGKKNPQRDWILTRILWLGGLYSFPSSSLGMQTRKLQLPVSRSWSFGFAVPKLELGNQKKIRLPT